MLAKKTSKNKFIFVGGVPRSGTSLLQKVLDMHPLIYGGPEFDNLINIISLYKKMIAGVENGRQSIFYSKPLLQNYFMTFIESLFSEKSLPSLEYISEKTPSNVLVFEDLINLFPEAKFILMIRDPRAIINSFQIVNRRAKKANIKVDVGVDLPKDVKLISKYLSYGQAFKTKHSDSCHVVYYEDLLTNPTETVKSLCVFLSINYQESMLDTTSTNDTSNLIAINKEINSWYNSSMYHNNIDASKLTEWQHSISNKDKRFINHYFYFKNYSLLSRYKFDNINFIDKILVAPIYIQEYGLIHFIERFYKSKYSLPTQDS